MPSSHRPGARSETHLPPWRSPRRARSSPRPPFVGPSGIELIRMLGESGLITLTTFDRDYIHRYYTTNDPSAIAAIWDLHPEVYRTNVFSTHPPLQ